MSANANTERRRQQLLLAGGGLALLLQVTPAAAAQWDCRAAPDGSRWICARDGQPIDEPLPPLPERPVAEQPAAEPETFALPEPPPRPAAPAAPAAATEAPQPVAQPAAPRTARPVQPPPAPAAPRPPAAPPAPTAPPPPAAVAPAAVTAIPTTPPAEPSAAAASVDSRADDAVATDRDDTGVAAVADVTTPRAVDGETADTTLPVSDPRLHAGLPWVCGRQQTGIGFDQPPGDGEVVLEADSVQAQVDTGRAVLIGNAAVTQGQQTLRADRIDYDERSGEVVADGAVLISRPGSRVGGERARYSTTTGQGEIESASYRVTGTQHARGTATRAELVSDGVTQFSDITYTTCRPGDNHWQLSAKTLELDQNEGVGVARGAVLNVGPLPLAYIPYMQFPIDDRRKSGLLPPSFGTSDNTGIDITVPYYLNLAPNYDMTLVPRVTEKRGAVLGGEFRFLTQQHSGEIRGEYLPDDNEFEGGGERGALNLVTRHRLTPRWRVQSRIDHVSDDDYLRDLGDSLAVSSTTELERIVETEYFHDDWSLVGRVQDFQRLDGGTDPYARLPEVVLRVFEQEGPAGSEWLARAEYADFAHDDLVEGRRIDLLPTVRLPFERPWGYLVPELGVSYTSYDLNRVSAGQDSNPDRTLPVVSIDGGLIFERQASLFGRSVRQELEPRLFYLYVPHEDQSDLPVFDTSLRDLSFSNLFRTNRFNGPDRFGDANQLTLAVTHRSFAETTDEELLALSIGNIIYFEDQRVALPGEQPDTDGQSVVAGEARARLSRHLRLTASAQWDPDRSIDDLDQAELRLAYRVDNNHIVNAAYRRRRRDDIDETDLSAIWPLSQQVVALMRWNYSIEQGRHLEAFAGLEYRDCCWGIRGLVRQYATSARDDNLSFLLQFELRGLGRLGDKIEDLLVDSVYGFERDED